MRRTVLLVALAAMVGALVAAPIAVYASHQFKDVPSSHLFHSAIAWLSDNGITKGCNPPTNDRFCPDSNVTRGQMAAFMKRLAEERVVDAGMLGGNKASAFLKKSEYDSNNDGINDLTPRATFKGTDNAPDGADFILTSTITAPKSGIIVASGGIEARNQTAFNSYSCKLWLNGSTIRGSHRTVQLDGTADVNEEEDCNTTGGTEVAAGTYTVELVVTGVAATTTLSSASVWATWVPLDGNGKAP